jgi:hypothetical protein
MLNVPRHFKYELNAHQVLTYSITVITPAFFKKKFSHFFAMGIYDICYEEHNSIEDMQEH